MMTQTIIRNFSKSKGSETVKIDGVTEMVVVLTHKKMSYLVIGLYDDLVGPLLY